MLIGKSDRKTSAVNNDICLAGISQQQIIKFRFFSSTAKKCDATQQKQEQFDLHGSPFCRFRQKKERQAQLAVLRGLPQPNHLDKQAAALVHEDIMRHTRMSAR